MTVSSRPPSRATLFASGVFFCAYLTLQVAYPTLPWFLSGYDRFTWQMFSGYDSSPRFVVIFDDGTRRGISNPTRPGGAVRLLGSSVDERAFIPSWLCVNWEGVRAVLAADHVRGGEEIIPCRSAAR